MKALAVADERALAAALERYRGTLERVLCRCGRRLVKAAGSDEWACPGCRLQAGEGGRSRHLGRGCAVDGE